MSSALCKCGNPKCKKLARQLVQLARQAGLVGQGGGAGEGKQKKSRTHRHHRTHRTGALKSKTRLTRGGDRDERTGPNGATLTAIAPPSLPAIDAEPPAMSPGPKIAVFANPGVYTFVVPKQCKSMLFEAIGGGGGGSAGLSLMQYGGGGGSGSYVAVQVTGTHLEQLRAGCPLQILVGGGGNGGAGGGAGSSTDGAAGELSSVSSLIVAGGGFGSLAPIASSVGVGGAGGVYNVDTHCGPPVAWKYLGVGGQRGSNAGLGTAAGSGGTAPIVCGPGGQGGSVSETLVVSEGGTGTQAGGGGGGGAYDSITAVGVNGGAGASGLVRITY